MNDSRGKKALYNSLFSLGLQFISLVCGLILPRLILSNYGSAYNGITSSITHFISCVSLMKAGLGGVTRAALYKPLAEKDDLAVSEVLYESELYIRKIAKIFLFGVFVFAAIYPIWTKGEFSWFFSFSLILIISLTTFINYYFCYVRSVLLEADQKIRIWSISEIASVVLNTILAAILIKLGATIHVVKLGSAITFLITPLILYWYTNKHYTIIKNAKPKVSRIDQRWDAFGHELSDFVNGNIDVMLITIFLNMKEVSVYTVYAYVATAIRRIVLDSVSGFNAAFGNMYAENNYDVMRENLNLYELILFSITTIIYSVAAVMITPFVMFYTSGVTDVNYERTVFGILLIFSNIFNCFRVPYNSVAQAAGHFKDTKKFAYIETLLNIVVSIIFVVKFGIIGVTIGTLVAAIYRATIFAFYLSKKIIPRSNMHYIKHVTVSIFLMFLVLVIGNRIITNVSSVTVWVYKAIIMTIISSILVLFSDILFWKNDCMIFTKKLLSALKLRKS